MNSFLSTVLLFFSVACLVLADECGIRMIDYDDQVTGVQKSSKDQFPWTVALQNVEHTGSVPYCGASVISDRWIVTAAHCVLRRNLSEIQGIFGTNKVDEKPYFVTEFSSVVIHEAYNAQTFENDIALLKTKNEIPSFGENVRRICIPKKDQDFSGRGVVSGWGRFTNDGAPGVQLKALTINLFDATDCESLYENLFSKSHMLCAGYIKGKYDFCEGNAGGPLEKVVNGRVHLIGIGSFGKGCAQPLNPGVYTKVSHHVGWIKKTLGPDFTLETSSDVSTKNNCPEHCTRKD